MRDAVLFEKFVNSQAAEELPLPKELAIQFSAERTKLDENSSSEDASELWTFNDGSKAIVDNPRGLCFDLQVTVL